MDQDCPTRAAAGLDRPDIDPQNAMAYAYIGMSRARGALVALVRDGLRGELEGRLAACCPASRRPGLSAGHSLTLG